MKEKEEGYQMFPAYTMRTKSRKGFFIILAVIFLLLGAVLAGLYLLGSPVNRKTAVLSEPTVTPIMTPLPTSSVSAVLTGSLTGTVSDVNRSPALSGTSRSLTASDTIRYPTTPSGEISAIDKATNLDRSKLGVAVLNGSGEAGAARGVSSYLEGLGYKILRVDNADVFTYNNLTVLVKKSKGNYAGLLRKDLQANPSFAASNAAYASVSASISDDITNDAEVIVGK